MREKAHKKAKGDFAPRKSPKKQKAALYHVVFAV
jgi:hypothetical protein